MKLEPDDVEIDEVVAPGASAPVHVRHSASVIVPAYNESAILVKNLGELYDYMLTLDDFDWEIVVVDDGSKDGTGDLAELFAASHPRVRVLRHRTNFQLGQALRFAFASCHTDYLVVIDADLSYSPDHIGRLLHAMEDTHARVVVASPYMKGGETTAVPPFRKAMSRWANRILGLAAKGDLHTLTGMVRAYDRRFLRTLNLKAMDNEINTEIIYKAQLLRGRIVEIPAHLDWTAQVSEQTERSSKLRVSRSTLSSVFVAFIFRPFMFFIVPGLVLLAMSAYMLVWIAIRMIQDYNLVPGQGGISGAFAVAYARAPYTFIVGGLSLIVSVQLLSLGIIALQAKRYFEELFHLGSSILKRVDVEVDA